MPDNPTDWTKHRLVEPSTHTAIAVFLAVLGLYLNSLTMEGSAAMPWLLGWGCIHALLGVILKEGKGLIR